MSHERSFAGRAQRQRAESHIVEPAASLSAAHFYLQATAAAPASHGTPLATAAQPVSSALLSPSYVRIVRAADGASKSAMYGRSAPAGTGQRAAVLLPHVDDIDEGIRELGYEKAMIAGASAGVVEHVFMFPVDTIKTRMQAVQIGGPEYKGVFSAITRIAREEGVRRLYRGFTATVAGAIPSHAMHFATYEHVKHRFGGSEPGHHPFVNGLAGGCATLAHDAIVTPLDVVKQRLQVYNSTHAGVLECIRTVLKQEGLRAFYASYPTTVAMNVPFQAVHFAAYESFKIFFTAPEEEHGFTEELFAGGAAGALAGFVSTPFDVIKTRLQTQEVPVGQNRLGAIAMARLILATDGKRGFWRGAQARMLYFTPSAAICWTTYEAMKRLLKDLW